MVKEDKKFALTNPICILTGKEPGDLTRDDLIKVIEEKGLERITFHYTALDGKIKELRIPVTNRKQAEMVLTEGERVDGSSLFKGIIDAGKSDLYVVPVYKSAFLNPFDETSIDFICRFLTADGELAPFTPDNILHKAAELHREKTGLELYAMGELEFYILSNPENNLYPIPKQKGYHASAPFVKSGEVLNEMVHHIAKITGSIKYAHHEVGVLENVHSDFPEINGRKAEQVEIEFLPTPVEETGDIIVLAKWIIRNVAYKHGFVATFCPKLEVGNAGTGMHFHIALMKDGKNVMLGKKGDLSKEAKQVIGGLCRYASSLTAYGNTVSASYLRLVPHQEAPTKVCWSEMNRSALIRVPLGWNNVSNLAMKVNPQQKTKLTNEPGRQTVELRSPDGSGIAHLLLAGLTMASEWGLSNEKESLDLAEKNHVTVNIHASGSSDDLAELATSCVESSERLLQHRNLYERDKIFPAVVINHVAKLLQQENDKNLNQRLLAMPDDEKIWESRRIMHRDIHKH